MDVNVNVNVNVDVDVDVNVNVDVNVGGRERGRASGNMPAREVRERQRHLANKRRPIGKIL